MTKRRTAMLIGATALLAGSIVAWVARERQNPSACPFSQRLFLDLPRPFMGRETLREVLAPVPGERVLEVGPGAGYYSLAVARWIAPGGRLDALALQDSMLDELMLRAGGEGIANIAATQGDGQAMPFPDATFDAAFFVATLGEIPDRDQALRELRRVLKPGGRLVVGEGQPDPHMIPLADMRERAEAAGFHFETDRGGRLGYLARFRTEGAGVLGDRVMGENT